MKRHTYDPTRTLPPGRAVFSVSGAPGDRDGLEHFASWAAHVEAGRIGNNPPMSERHRAKHEAQKRQFRRLFES